MVVGQEMQTTGSFRAGGDAGGKGFLGVFGGFGHGDGLFNDGGVLMSSSSSSSLVLDSERGELVKSSDLMRREMVEAKATMALKSHSEAERRRRERINRHLTTLRGLVPCTTKMDKASLLAEVINNVKELKRNAEALTKGCIVPTDFDEVRVEFDGGSSDKGTFYIKASICCDDRPELWSELKQMMQNLQLKTVSAETSTLGARVKNVFIFMAGEHVDEAKQRSSARSVQQALKAVVKRVASSDFSPRSTVPSKRQRSSPFESSSSSS